MNFSNIKLNLSKLGFLTTQNFNYIEILVLSESYFSVRKLNLF